jgi:hypothetical protein
MKDAETQNHLLNICTYNSQVWDQCATVMHISDRKRESLRTTIEEWWDVAFQSPILNRIWQLLPGFILWKLWKERNRRIFLNTQRDWQFMLDPKLHQHQRNNQSAALDRSGPDLSNSRTGHHGQLESHFKTDILHHTSEI